MIKRIGLAISNSVKGPWKRLERPVIEPRINHWDASITSNVAMADNPQGPYRRLSEEPKLRFETEGNNRRDVEDPYIWWNGKHYEGIVKDRSGEICGEEGGGIHMWSKDGIKWNLFEQIKAYSRDIVWDDGSRSHQNHFERTWNMVIPLRKDM
jgi:hypothetical protein